MKKILTVLVVVCALTLISFQVHAVELKIATLAPQGTSMHNTFEKLGKDIKAATGGRVSIKIFGGGVQGDEKDVVRKMRYGQLDGAALTGVGMGMIDPQIRVLELPFLFKNSSEVDKVYAGMEPFFKSAFSNKGFELLGWAEVGFVKIFSNKAIREKTDLKGVKMWMWEGDPLAKAMYDAMGVTPVPLAITDVLTSLQTNLIDAAYAPEFGAIGFQWHTKTKYMTDVNLVNGTGGIILTKKAWAKISGGDKAIIKNLIKAEAKKLVQQTRQDNLESKQAVKSAGIQVVTPTPEAVEELRQIGKQVRTTLVGNLYSQQLLDMVLSKLK
ncbi:MAG: TRAP transporter substrate-binding protein DctP [bacterium]|nr:TRAP transporter substrate-binding protein DctP [bacterium]MBU1916885.1 TRAP transporter substrate-binding protein DctP [bacterium]